MRSRLEFFSRLDVLLPRPGLVVEIMLMNLNSGNLPLEGSSMIDPISLLGLSIQRIRSVNRSTSEFEDSSLV